MARTRAALALVAIVATAFLLFSGGSRSDPRTPPPLPGMPPPFLTVAVLGSGGLTAGIDAYGDVVDLRAPGPAGTALVDNPHERQEAGTVPVTTGIVPRVSLDGGTPQPLWQADSVRQSYLPGTNVLRTVARFGAVRVAIDCAAGPSVLGCLTRLPRDARVRISSSLDLVRGTGRVHLDDALARRTIHAAAVADRRWLGRALPLGGRRGRRDSAEIPPPPAWARRLYERSLLALRALTDRRSGAVAAGARDGWAYVWPRDAGSVAIAFEAAGYRPEARRVARFLLGLDLEAAARFDGSGEAVEGRAAQGDAAGWVAAAARAAKLPSAERSRARATARAYAWRDRADYQEKSPGDYLANALAAGAWRLFPLYGGKGAMRTLAGDTADSEFDSAAAWAVRPFPRPTLFPAARRTLLALEYAQRRRYGPDATRFGLIPSEDWPEADPWTAPTAWSAWSLAALSRLDERPATAAHDRDAALRLLASLRRAATPAGLLPERVDARTGVPRSTTPLAWSHAFAVLALRKLWPGSPAGR